MFVQNFMQLSVAVRELSEVKSQTNKTQSAAIARTLKIKKKTRKTRFLWKLEIRSVELGVNSALIICCIQYIATAYVLSFCTVVCLYNMLDFCNKYIVNYRYLHTDFSTFFLK